MKVLIIDSNRFEMAKFYLANKENQIYGAFTNQEAIDILKNNSFDYISFGDNLPVVDYMIRNKHRCSTARVHTYNNAKLIMNKLIKGNVTNEVIQTENLSMEQIVSYCSLAIQNK